MGYLSKKQLADSFRLYGFDFRDCMGLVNDLEISDEEKTRLMEEYVNNRESCVSETLLHKWSKSYKESFWRYGNKKKEAWKD